MSSYFENLLVGCGSRGLATLNDLLKDLPEESKSKTHALEASSRIGGTQFLISRLAEAGTENTSLYEVQRQLPELKIWWEREWLNSSEVDWQHADWAYVLPQWQSFFKALVELKVKTDIFESVKPFVELEKPVSEITYSDGLWTVHSGEKTYTTHKLHWTLGLKALQACVGKKQAEVYMEKNPQFNEAARDAEGVFVADYLGAQGESKFIGIPVRHDHKLYLCFVSLHEGRVETFTFLHNDLLKQPKELSSFEKAVKRTLKHTLSNHISELSSPTLGVFTEAKGYSLASPWRLKTLQEKGIYFVNEELSL
ncbi:MAG: hypothetical protein R3A80_02995 [Bdellovibrionota bacterium]